MFNYASFCKILSIYEVRNMIEQLLKDQQFISWNLKNVVDILTQEILKLFVKQIPCLKKLEIVWCSHGYAIPIIPDPLYSYITSYPGARDCFKNLSELHCNSDIDSEFFYHLSKFCHVS